MSGPAARVQYLAHLGCPLGAAARGRARVLGAGARLFLSTGGRFVHVYDREGQQLSAVLEFPAPVWHLQPLDRPAALLALCARSGLYRVALDPASSRDSVDCTGSGDSRPGVDSTDHGGDGTGSGDSRPGVDSTDHGGDGTGSGDCGHGVDSTDHRGDGTGRGDCGHGVDSEPPLRRTTVGPAACVLPDPTLTAFVMWGHTLITLAQGPARWKVQLTPCPAPGQELMPLLLAREVDLPVGTAPGGRPGPPLAPDHLPVLYLVDAPGPRSLDAALLGLLFGADACLLCSPVLLCGLPSGQLCALLLHTLVTSDWAPDDPQAPVRTIHHLEEPVVLVGALRTEPPAEGPEDAPRDCLVALGHGGRLLAIKARRDEAGSPALELREYHVPGPVLCAACDGGSRLFLSTASGLHVVDLAQGGDVGEPGALPSDLCPASTSVCSLAALTVPPSAPGGDTRLLALSARGRLLACSLGLPEWPLLAGSSRAGGAQHVRDLLSGVAATSERVSSLKARAEQQNQALQGLNEAMAVTSALLSGREGPKPLSCHVQASWVRLPSGDALLACCELETGPACSLGLGWALCVSLLQGLSLEPAATFTLPLSPLGPSSRRSLTLPLSSGEASAPQLPVTVSCRLFYSLRDGVAAALGPGALPEHEGVDLPLGHCVVDVLHALRFPRLPAPAAPLCSPHPDKPPRDPVDAFLQAQCGQDPEPEAQYLPPTGATLTVSVQLLQTALAGQNSDLPLGPATLQWLLSGNTDAAKAPALSCLQGVAPDGTSVLLLAREVCVPDTSPAEPLQAVEIRVESPSLAVLCAVHHAVTRRVQTVILEQASCGTSIPELHMQYLQRVQASHETLLREVRTLQEQLRLGEEAAPHTTAQRILQTFQQLRGPGLLLL